MLLAALPTSWAPPTVVTMGLPSLPNNRLGMGSPNMVATGALFARALISPAANRQRPRVDPGWARHCWNRGRQIPRDRQSPNRPAVPAQVMRTSSMVFVIFCIAPRLFMMEPDPIWFMAIIGVNLPTASLTPPFGLPLFYLRVALQSVSATHICRGVVPFSALQVIMLLLLTT